jgi:CPA1 family monovalent cation:H+ antiporter
MTTNAAIQFLIWALIAASIIAVLAARLRISYTVALVLAGLVLGSVHLPILETLISQKPDWLTPDVSLIVFLPALLFEGSLKIQFRQLRENVVPILLLATIGVLVATLIAAFAVHWVIGVAISTALVFGAIISATDPISVLAIFADVDVNKRLSVIVEGESLFNDGTAAVLFGIFLSGVATGDLGVGSGIRSFVVEVLGGAAVGVILGYVFSKITQKIDEPQVEITLTTVLAYGSYLVAQSAHLSGVIATVAAGLMIGNFGVRAGMAPRTRLALWSFWGYASFVINSVVFLLIGLRVHIAELLHAWPATLLGIGAVILGRIVSVYGLTAISNLLTEKIPVRWQHVMVCGGMRGALSLALVLSLGREFPHREQILAMTFGVVAFTLVVQGLTIKPLLRVLGLGTSEEGDYERARVRKIAVSSALAELGELLQNHLISAPVYERLRRELETRLQGADAEIDEIYAKDEARLGDEVRMAKARLVAAEKSSIEQAFHDGLISSQTAMKMIDAADQQLNEPPESRN